MSREMSRRPLLASLLLRFASSVRGVLLQPLARPLACAGELTAVHQLPALRFPPPPPRCCSTCSCRHWHLCSANGSTMAGCDWRGPSVEEPLHHTHMHTLESIVWNRFLECSAGDDLRLPTMHLIPYPATDIMHKIQWRFGPASADALQTHYAQVKTHLASTAAWQKCGGCDHVMVLSRSAADYPQTCPYGCGQTDPEVYQTPQLKPDPNFARTGQFRIDDPFWENVTFLTQEQIPPAHAVHSSVFPMARPSSMHPRSHRELLAWQRRMQASRRDQLFTLAAAAKSHRAGLITACRSSQLCRFVDCARPGGVMAHTRANGCHPANLYQLYARSVYCLMPFGGIRPGTRTLAFRPPSHPTTLAERPWFRPRVDRHAVASRDLRCARRRLHPRRVPPMELSLAVARAAALLAHQQRRGASRADATPVGSHATP